MSTARPAPKRLVGKPKRGRPAKDRDTTNLSLYIARETVARLDERASEFKVERADFLRWLVDDAASGAWVPSHLAKIINKT